MTKAEKISEVLASLLKLGIANDARVRIDHGHWHILQQGRWVRLTDAMDAKRRVA